jgi:hypothetical protein
MSFSKDERLLNEIDVLLRSHARTGVDPLVAIVQLTRDSARPLPPEPPVPTYPKFEWPQDGCVDFSYSDSSR